ncbi:carbonic anhydrase [Metapseudomonas resinovorans]|uniref:carbonic anhydrase n=1 Tax=Metapseudomonas resinovorans NBRC 106553 TaxID=1245471 RepID=S6APY6_METRE|nr:carbonic anhydrase [Pseudomonas resinovorans]BAN47788.1 putative carbonic anhydrase [Pseudomonas resinovorans NBRC 106553]
MCTCHEHAEQPARRDFLRLAGVTVATAVTASLLPTHALAASPAEPPKPENQLSPQAAFDRLMAGNRRYIEGVARRHDFLAEREALVSAQNPFVAVLSCADSRIAPEYAFDTGRGDLFAVRVAGNLVNDDGLGSLEYGVAVLGIPLLMVLGHEGCGAVEAGVKAVRDKASFPGHIQRLADAIAPAVKATLDKPGDPLDNAIRQNVLDNMRLVKERSEILRTAIDEGRLKLVGGLYRLADGKVELLG